MGTAQCAFAHPTCRTRRRFLDLVTTPDAPAPTGVSCPSFLKMRCRCVRAVAEAIPSRAATSGMSPHFSISSTRAASARVRPNCCCSASPALASSPTAARSWRPSRPDRGRQSFVGWAKAHRAVPTILCEGENGGHASLCPPYAPTHRPREHARHLSFMGLSPTTRRSIRLIRSERSASAALMASVVCRNVLTFDPSDTMPPSTAAIEPRAAT